MAKKDDKDKSAKKRIATVIFLDENGEQLIPSGNNTDRELFMKRVNKKRKIYTPEEFADLQQRRRDNFMKNCGEYMFKPGECGSSTGRRGKTPEEVKRIIKESAEDCLNVILKKAQDPTDKDQYAAATQILDRVYGKPNQPIEETSNKEINVVIKGWDDEQNGEQCNDVPSESDSE